MVCERCADLSRGFGAAQWYGMSCGDGWTAWCIAEGGEVVRFYDAFDAAEKGDEGPGHPAESGYRLPHEHVDTGDAFDAVGDLPDGAGPLDVEAFYARYVQVKRDLGIPDTCYATDIAVRLSVDPGARTRITGTGVLALTACGRRYGHPAGALEV
ncbi:hypothetical protein QF037_008036 [Streptomyces canus]|uniref:hypothetical protein n=1 Tax=Streptomyces canus TaxID=58343 RepID=UPI00277F092B|nr:hypothetical protein [Streptomyces canus]MDQ0603691.1 hypothetical protein [Streptomyces canus]